MSVEALAETQREVQARRLEPEQVKRRQQENRSHHFLKKSANKQYKKYFKFKKIIISSINNYRI
jgi:hypothetical protein